LPLQTYVFPFYQQALRLGIAITSLAHLNNT
jgi:hypothetical protein